MRRVYQTPCHRAYVLVRDWHDGDAEIQRLHTARRSRRRGLMRGLMREVIEDADREGVCLILTVGEGSATGMSAAQLYDWYNRLGFNGLAGNRMERPAMVSRA